MGRERGRLHSPVLCDNWLTSTSGDITNEILDIKCGYNHSLVLSKSLEVYSCGLHSAGQLGRTPSTDSNGDKLVKIPYLSNILRIECGNNHSMCLDINDNFFVFGDNSYGQLGIQGGLSQFPIQHTLSDVIDISSGGNHTFVKTSCGKIFAFGKNDHSQLGVETVNSGLSNKEPIQVFQDNEDYWSSNISKSNAKSARVVIK